MILDDGNLTYIGLLVANLLLAIVDRHCNLAYTRQFSRARNHATDFDANEQIFCARASEQTDQRRAKAKIIEFFEENGEKNDINS